MRGEGGYTCLERTHDLCKAVGRCAGRSHFRFAEQVDVPLIGLHTRLTVSRHLPLGIDKAAATRK